MKGIWSVVKHLADPNGVAAKAGMAIVMFFAGVHSYIGIIIALVLMDVVTGITASMKLGIPFSSKKLRKGLIEKLVLYFTLLLSIFFLDKLIMGDIAFRRFYFSFFITFLISVYETSSIIENMVKIRPDSPFLNGLIGIFKSMGDKAMESMKKRTEGMIDRVTEFEQLPSISETTEPMSGDTI